MTNSRNNGDPCGLGVCLVKAGLLSDSHARAYHESAVQQHIPFVSFLVSGGLVDSRAIANAAARELGLPLLDLDAMDLSLAPVKLVSERLIREHRILPLFKRGNRLFVAFSDPTHFQAINEVKFHTRLHTEAVVVEEEKLAKALEIVLEQEEMKFKELMDEDLENIQVSAGEEDLPLADKMDSEVEDAPIVRFVNKILLDAVKKGASDIHFEPYEKFFRIRCRHDGILHEVTSPPINLAARILARVKVMARLNIAERRVPQDGRIKMTISKNRTIDFRVNSCPTLFGEKIVLRILDPATAQLGIDRLGFEEEQKRLFLEAINKPYGMILVTGPTGSGKTMTLYSGLNILNQPGVNISTAEDPVEITVPGINQVHVNPKAGLTFAEALRAFMRQDPDIIMVGEIRDLETAEIAVKAAQTGHLVLSTLHTNDAPQSLNRLMQIGIPPYNVASSVLLIMAQRLARRLCEHCKIEEKLPPNLLLKAGFKEQDVEGLMLFGPGGCDRCVKGYKGRTGIFQVMPVSDAINHIILEGGNVIRLTEQARLEAIADLRESGLKKVKAGITSLEEIDRVTKD
ncbi:MAG TPA: type IV-A pilus assembly ATPase PilB [Methylococcaceae bacterium]|nr:type IV-A pilus assembly ATPase PilB [Methylococcaceae bacterium]